MPAKAATQIQVNTVVIRRNRSVLTTSAGCSAAANSRTNGLPISTPTRATRKIPALLSGCIQPRHERLAERKGQHGQHEECCDGTRSRAFAPGFLVARPIANTATAISKRDQHGGVERDVTDKHPIDDPRRKANEHAHEASVYGRRFAGFRRPGGATFVRPLQLWPRAGGHHRLAGHHLARCYMAVGAGTP